jgi:hypothetical protein
MSISKRRKESILAKPKGDRIGRVQLIYCSKIVQGLNQSRIYKYTGYKALRPIQCSRQEFPGLSLFGSLFQSRPPSRHEPPSREFLIEVLLLEIARARRAAGGSSSASPWDLGSTLNPDEDAS